MKPLDLRDLKCPAPVVETRKALLASPQEPQAVLVGDTMARDNVQRLAETLGYTISVLDTGDGFLLEMTPDEDRKSEATSTFPIQGKTVVYIGNDAMGGDNRELGQKLMQAFLGTLVDVEPKPDLVLFINEGVRLTTGDSPVLEVLSKLEAVGVELVSCGLCLDFFNVKDDLKAGRVGNMFETAEAFLTAGRIVRP